MSCLVISGRGIQEPKDKHPSEGWVKCPSRVVVDLSREITPVVEKLSRPTGELLHDVTVDEAFLRRAASRRSWPWRELASGRQHLSRVRARRDGNQ